MKQKFSILFGIFFAIILIAGFLYWAMDDKSPGMGLKPELNTASLFSESIEEPEYQPVYQGSLESDRFYHEGFGFSFRIPEGYQVQQVPYGDGFELIAIEKASTRSGQENPQGFQISIIPYDEINPITPERILVDLPDKIINNPKEALLDGEPALVFGSVDQDIGETFEVWFPYEGHLYQILTYRYFAGALSQVLDNWRFEN